MPQNIFQAMTSIGLAGPSAAPGAFGARLPDPPSEVSEEPLGALHRPGLVSPLASALATCAIERST